MDESVSLTMENSECDTDLKPNLSRIKTDSLHTVRRRKQSIFSLEKIQTQNFQTFKDLI